MQICSKEVGKNKLIVIHLDSAEGLLFEAAM